MPVRRNARRRKRNAKKAVKPANSETSDSIPTNQTVIDCSLKGFKIIKMMKPAIFELPFKVEITTTLETFTRDLLPECDKILIFDKSAILFSNAHRRMVDELSKSSDAPKAFEMLISKIQSFCEKLPSHVETLEQAFDIGQFWINMEENIFQLAILFGSLSSKDQTISDVFLQCCSNEFKKNVDVFKKASMLILESYNDLRSTHDESPLSDSARFLKETGLFTEYFVPLFVENVVEYMRPTVDKAFLSDFGEYLQTVTELSENEIQLASVFNFFNCKNQLIEGINNLIFSSKVHQIYDKCLKPLLIDQDIESIWICSKLSRSTNSFDAFINEMSLLFEEEAIACFKSNDPIQEFLKLYQSLLLFCDRSCGPQSTRTVRLAFERGFNSEPETVARLLALSVNELFSQKPSRDQEIDYDLIDQYVALFRMLVLNDIFETYHTQLLTRRIIIINDKMAEREEYFSKRLKQQCGSEYTTRMDDILNDRRKSKELLETSPKLPDFFKCIVLSSQIAKPSNESLRMKIPKSIETALTTFAKHYKSNVSGRNIEWDIRLSISTLTVNNVKSLTKVKCSCDIALVLLALTSNNKNYSLKNLAKTVGCSQEQILPLLKILKSKKSYKLVVKNKSNDEYHINLETSPPNGILKIPFLIPQIVEKDAEKIKKVIVDNKDNQLDAAIISVVKAEKSIEKEFLYNKVISMVKFNTTNEFFETRLQSLSNKGYLKIDPAGKVHYVS